jgi:hypothetical protein
MLLIVKRVSRRVLLFLLKIAYGVECHLLHAVTNFKDPAPKNAVKTLVTMGSILAFLLVGIVGLAYVYGIMPQTETTVLSHVKPVFAANTKINTVVACTK